MVQDFNEMCSDLKKADELNCSEFYEKFMESMNDDLLVTVLKKQRQQELQIQSSTEAYLDLQMLSNESASVEAPGFDWTAATIGAGVGFVAGYAIIKTIRRKKDDEFNRA